MDLAFCPALAEMVQSRQAVGQSGRVFEGLGALSTVNNLHVLRACMLYRRPARTLEIGLSFGGSALAIAASHRDIGREPGEQHIALDPFQVSDWDNAGLAALLRAGLDGYVEFRPHRSDEGLMSLVGEGQTFSLIYIDGSHLFEDVFVDASFAFRVLADDGIVLFDDCTIDHVAKVLSFVRANWCGWTEEVDLSRYRPAGGSLRYKLGQRMGKLQLRAFRRTGVDTRAWDAPLRRF